MNEKERREGFHPSGFFACRTPLLPLEELEAWGEGLEGVRAINDPDGLAGALARDRERLRSRLRERLNDPVLREAIFLASPSLTESLSFWFRDPDGDRGRRAECASAWPRYLMGGGTFVITLHEGTGRVALIERDHPRARRISAIG